MTVFITGGAGFIGCNLADYHLRRGDDVIVFDNLSRRGTASNLAWLQQNHGERVSFVKGDNRDFEALRSALPARADRVYHMAGQVAVTTSVANPREDFEINTAGTFNLLEAVRANAPIKGKAERELGWAPQLSMREGVTRLWQWIDANPQLFD